MANMRGTPLGILPTVSIAWRATVRGTGATGWVVNLFRRRPRSVVCSLLFVEDE